MTTERELGRAVIPQVDEIRLARQWARIRPRIGARRPSAAPWLVSGAVAVCAVAVVVLLTHVTSPRPSAWDGAIVETEAEPTAVTLGDGSRIDLSGRSRLEVVRRGSDAVEVRMLHGRARFDVARDPSRVFSVLAADVAVRVVGTRFSVGLEPRAAEQRVVVRVERGSVECIEGERRVVLGAGQSWTSAAANAGGGAPAAERPAELPHLEPDVPGESGQPAEVPELPSGEAPVAEPALPAPPTARQLFEDANAARLSGDFASAAEGYRALLTSHPNDSRAGLAAFELGRLLQDRFGDAAGAARALGRALSTSTGAGFKEDALARLVRAYATMGARDECERARSAYLEGYPTGVHKTAVERACGNGP